MELAGATALVSGGASGLGWATAQQLTSAGASVVLLDLPSSAGDERAAELGDAAAFVPGDVTDEEQVGAAVEAAVQRFGGLQVAVSCAGIGTAARVLGREGPHDLEAFTTVLDVNTVGTFNVLRLAAAAMAAADDEQETEERGVIVNTASIAAFDGQVGQIAYSASKGAIVGMTLPAARDLARSRIRVNTIAPGTFDTPLLGELPEEARTGLAASIPHPARLGSPAEYALLVRQVVENPYLNGATIRLDGALRMAPR